ncbi:MAG: DNA repair protein RecO [Chloroflexi bacterium]|nr:DNA repair protein RecO [Chloroflexota bacterium]
MIPRVYKTEAIVLRGILLGEADRILTLYSPWRGKVRAVARGVRRPTSRLGGHVEPLIHGSYLLARGQELDVVTQGETIHSFPRLRDDLGSIGGGLYAAELIYHSTSEGVENYPLFRLLLDTLMRLDGEGSVELALRYFELHLLGHLGYRPQLGRCVACQGALPPTVNFFTASGGGVLCPSCHPPESSVRRLSLNALKTLRFFQEKDWAQASRLKVSPPLMAEIKGALREFILYHLERELKSTLFMDLVGGHGSAASGATVLRPAHGR